MAERIAEAYVQIIPTTVGIQSALSAEMGVAGAGAGAAAGKGLSGGIKNSIAPIAGIIAAAGIGRALGDAFAAAEEGQRVDATLQQVTTSMGLFGAGTDSVVGRLQAFATEQMKLTGVDDDVIKSAQTKLMTFKELGASAGETGGMFDRATQASMDMATVFGGDASSKAVMLGKALNDPIKGVSALSRVGVQFTDDQKKMIEGMMEAGDIAGAQAIIMGEVETQVGGAAAASATAGDIMAASWDDTVQALGTALLPALEAVQGFLIEYVIPAIGFLSENTNILIPILAGLASIILVAVIPTIWAFTTALLANPFTWIVLGVGLLIAGLTLLIMNWDAVVSFLSDTWNAFTSWIGNSLKAFGNGWNSFWSGVGKVVTGIWGNITKGIQTAWGAIVSWFGGAFATFGKFFSDFWSGLVNGIGKVFGGIVNFVKAPLNAIIDALNAAIKGINSLKIKVPDWVPGIGGQVWGFNIATIPRLATGGTLTSSGSVMVGEKGAEILTLPRGATVTPLDRATGKTINYYAAPDQSLDSEEALMNAMRRASVVAGW